MSQRSDHHELGGGHLEIETSSDRWFGLVFAAAFALLAAYFGWRGACLVAGAAGSRPRHSWSWH